MWGNDDSDVLTTCTHKKPILQSILYKSHTDTIKGKVCRKMQQPTGFLCLICTMLQPLLCVCMCVCVCKVCRNSRQVLSAMLCRVSAWNVFFITVSITFKLMHCNWKNVFCLHDVCFWNFPEGDASHWQPRKGSFKFFKDSCSLITTITK